MTPATARQPRASEELVARYDVPGPRYTSYPTVPCWDESRFDTAQALERFRAAFERTNDSDGISVYVHLPYCESLCTFCGCNRQISRRHDVEAPYVDDLLREWSLYLERLGARPRIRELHLGGGTPTFFSPANLGRLIESMLAGAEPCEDASFGFEAHPNSTTPGHLRVLHELGFRRLSLGVQDFDPAVQKVINRVQSEDTVRAVTEAARETGFESVNFDLVYGLPLQREAGIADTVERVLALAPDRIAFYGYAHVPWKRGVHQRGFSESDLPRGASRLGLYLLGRDLLEQGGYRDIGLDHFALAHDELYRAAADGSLHRNFMGYTPTHTRVTIGIGASAIGDSWDAFMQNEKHVKQWSRRVRAGELAVFRGHLLDEEDRVIRRHVLDVMCRFHADWSEPARWHPSLEEALPRLQPMREDGLVALSAHGLSVTEAGRAFLRNACMALDARLWRERSTSERFSRAV